MAIKNVSFRSQLKGNLSDFLTKEDMCCANTEEGLLALVVSLSHYTEEGITLFPEVILCANLEITLRILQCTSPLFIGSGEVHLTTFSQALKRCAPLAKEGWLIFIERVDNQLKYGVFRSSGAPTAVSIRDTIQAFAEDNANYNIIYISQLARSSVELLGTNAGSLRLYFSATSEEAPSPRADVERLVSACSSSIVSSYKEQFQCYLKEIFCEAFKRCHGVLLAVIKPGSLADPIGKDGVIFSTPIPLLDIVSQHEDVKNGETLAALNAYMSLLIGMLSSDGIVVLDSGGQLLAYRVFLSEPLGEKVKDNEIVGGARKRAFNKLQAMVEQGDLNACFILSSDGTSQFCEG